jgi:Ca2+-binding EF-hand superfamily protein
MFDSIDFDGGGELSRSELFVGLMNLGQAEHFSEKEILGMINAADKDRNDSIDFTEFW